MGVDLQARTQPTLPAVLGFIPPPRWTACARTVLCFSSQGWWGRASSDYHVTLLTAPQGPAQCLMWVSSPSQWHSSYSYLVKRESPPPILCARSSALVSLINLAKFKLLGRGRGRIQTQIWPQMSQYFVPLGSCLLAFVSLPVFHCYWGAWKEESRVREIHCMNVSKMLSHNTLPRRPRTKSSSRVQLCGLHIDVKTFPLVLIFLLVGLVPSSDLCVPKFQIYHTYLWKRP